jgi:hypothetical protein
MAGAGIGKAVEVIDRQVIEPILQFSGKFSGAATMLWVAVFIPAATVVQEGKQFDDLLVGAGFFCQLQAVSANARPVRKAMHTAPIKPELGVEVFKQRVDLNRLVAGHESEKSALAGRWQIIAVHVQCSPGMSAGRYIGEGSTGGWI